MRRVATILMLSLALACTPDPEATDAGDLADAGVADGAVQDAAADDAAQPDAWAPDTWAPDLALLLEAGLGDGPVNRATLTGDPYGAGTEDNALLHRVVTAIDLASSTVLHVEAATISRPSTDETFLYAVLPITNSDDSPRCMVAADEIAVRTGSGLVVWEESATLALGSMRWNEVGGVITDTCVEPGEIAHILFLDDVEDVEIYDAIQSVEVRLTFDDNGAAWLRPPARLLPTGYSLDSGNVVVTAVNIAAAGLSPASCGVIYLDDQERPLHWASMPPYFGVFAPGEERELGSFLPRWNGSSQHLLVSCLFGSAKD